MNAPLECGFPRLSLVTRIIPSPDWFVGLDSLDLCRNGGFIPFLQVLNVIRSVCVMLVYQNIQKGCLRERVRDSVTDCVTRLPEFLQKMK